MKLNRAQLLATLKLVAPALAAKEIIEQSTSFVFRDGQVLAYNDEIAVGHPLDSGLEGAVKAEELLALLGKLKDEEVELETSDAELLIRGKRSRAGIALEAEIQLPLETIQEPEHWTKLPEGFVEALSFCHFSAGRDMAKPVLTCIHVKGDVAESCDNFRITRHKLASRFRGELLLPAAAAKTLVGYAPVECGLTDGWAHFRNADGVTFSARVFEGEYPDLSPFLEIGAEAVEVKLPGDLEGMLDRAGVFAAADFKQDERVTLTLEGRTMTVGGKGAVGWFEEECPVRWSGKGKVEFGIHPKFLLDILSGVEKVLVDEAQGRLRIEGEAFSHLILLSV